MLKKTELAKCLNPEAVIFTKLPEDVKAILKGNRGTLEFFNRDRAWEANPCGEKIHSNIPYRLSPRTPTRSEWVTVPLDCNGNGDYTARAGYGVEGRLALAHLVTKRGFKEIVYRSWAGETRQTRVSTDFGTPIAVVFDSNAL